MAKDKGSAPLGAEQTIDMLRQEVTRWEARAREAWDTLKAVRDDLADSDAKLLSARASSAAAQEAHKGSLGEWTVRRRQMLAEHEKLRADIATLKKVQAERERAETITVHDHFAAAALTGLLSTMRPQERAQMNNESVLSAGRASMAFADVMMSARNSGADEETAKDPRSEVIPGEAFAAQPTARPLDEL